MKQKMKSIVAIVLAFGLALSAAGCSAPAKLSMKETGYATSENTLESFSSTEDSSVEEVREAEDIEVSDDNEADVQQDDIEVTDTDTEDNLKSEEDTELPEDGQADEGEQVEEQLPENEPKEENLLQYPRTLTAEGKDYTVTATIGEDAQLPEDVELQVTPIDPKSELYQTRMQEAQQKLAEEAGEDAEPDFALFQLYDIAFVSNGKEIEPAAPVQVSLHFKAVEELVDPDNANVIHFDEEQGAEVIENPAVSADEDGSVTAEFETESFSEYAVCYTVDFQREENGQTYEFSIPGGGFATLPEIFRMVGVDKDAAEAEDVAFSNPGLVWIGKAESDITVGGLKENCGLDCQYSADLTKEQIAEINAQKIDAGEWVLISEQPFSGEETLTVTFKNQEQYKICVTDAQRTASNEYTDLSHFLTKVTVSGASLDGGSYVVQPGRDYSVTMTFKESAQYQFDNHNELTYQMPTGITLPQDSTTSIIISIVSNGTTYQIPATVTADRNGKVSVRFDETNPNFRYLENATNVGFRVTVNAHFNQNITKTEWRAKVERDIILDDTDKSDAYVTKTGVYNEQTRKFTYTIKVTAIGKPKNVNVKDVISGNALSFNRDVTVTGYDNGTYTTNPTDNGFDYTFPEMQDGQEITITYSASVDPSKAADGIITADQTRNTVTVRKEGGDPHTAEYSHSIDLVNLHKSDGEDAGVTSEGEKLYSWRIDYNELALVSVKGDTITDTIDAASQAYMKYYGDVTLKVLDSQGEEIRTTTFTPEGYSWSYVIPDTDTAPYHYVFEYQTIVDQSDVNQATNSLQLINKVSDGGRTDIGVIYADPVEKTIITKAVESSSPTEVTWVSHIHVPASGLSHAVVTDTLPSIAAHLIGIGSGYSTQLYDAYKNGSLVVTGRLPGESYKVQESEDKVVLTFYQDSDKTRAGLQAHPGGHNITIKLTTKVNQDWLQYGYEHPTYWEASHHKNKIDINTDTFAEAEATFAKPGLTKTGSDMTGYAKQKHFLYTLVLSNVTESPIVIEDTFDTSMLEVATDSRYLWGYFKIWGGNQYNIQSEGTTSVNYSDTATGIRITADNVPRQENGEFYPYYKIQYILRLKEGIDLDDLAIENGGEFDLTNIAQWGDYTSSYTFTTEYDFLDKELLEDESSTDRHVKYKITFNPKKAELNGGQGLVMTDTLNEHLSIDYTSVQIITEPEGLAVPYVIDNPNEEGKTIARFMIPDSTKVVITYDAMVIGTGQVRCKNVVEVKGKKETVDETVTIDISGEGEGAIPLLNAVKLDGYDASKKLAGVQFKLYSADLTPEGKHYDLSLPNSEEPEVYEKILTTDENGVLTIDGNKMKLFYGVKYNLEEVAPLDGYQNLSSPYQFKLVDNMKQVDHTKNIYFYSDSFQIKNWPLEGLVVEKQVESSEESDFTRAYSFKVSILTENGSVDTSFNTTDEDEYMTFNEGIASFTLKNGEQKSARNLPAGTKFKVEEKDADGYTVSTTVGETTGEGTSCKGETSADYTLVTFTNRRFVLPSTGGPGTGLFTVSGTILIAGTGLLLWRRRRLI